MHIVVQNFNFGHHGAYDQ